MNDLTHMDLPRKDVRPLLSFLIFLCIACGVMFGCSETTLGNSPLLSNPTISGPSYACAGTSGHVYTTEAGMSGYIWGISSGGIITAGVGTNSITVTWSGAGTQNVTVTYAGATSLGTINVVVDPMVLPTVAIQASANPVCQGSSVLFTAVFTNGGTSPQFQWKVNGMNFGSNSNQFSYVPAHGDVVVCQMISNATCISASTVNSNSISMVVNPIVAVNATISCSSNPICEGVQVTYNATIVNGGSAPTYQWKVNGANVGSNSATYQYLPTNGDVIQCIGTSSLGCTSGNPASSNTISMLVVANQTVTLSISPSANPCCAGSPVTLSSTSSGGGTNPVYEWRVNGVVVGSSSTTYTYVPQNGDQVTCRLTSNAGCAVGNPAQSNVVVMDVVQPANVSISITPSSNPVCQGVPVTYTATTVNGGSTPQFQWYVNGFPVGTNAPTITLSPSNGDVVVCHLSSSLLCPISNPAISNAVSMIVNPTLSTGLSIVVSANPICQGSGVTFSAAPYNGGANPAYQWFVNGVSAGGNSASFSYTPLNGDVIHCEMTSSAVCAFPSVVGSNSITMSVSPIQPVSASIVASLNPVCQGTPVDFSATVVNGGITPIFQWKVNGVNAGGNQQIFTYSPTNGDVVNCVVTSQMGCTSGNPATTNSINMSVIPTTGMVVSVTIQASASTVCSGQSIQYTATPVNGGATPTYQWFVNGMMVGTNSPSYSHVPVNGQTVQCRLTSSYTCPTGNPAYSNIIVTDVDPYLPVGIAISASTNPVCQGSSVAYTATPTNGGTSPFYSWRVNGVVTGSNATTFSYVPANGDAVTCVLTSNYNCPTGNPATSAPIVMTVNPLIPASVSIVATANPVCQGSSVTFTSTPTNGGTTPYYQWKRNGANVGSHTNTYTLIPTNGDVITCQMTTNSTCYSGSATVTSNPITMSITPLSPVGVTITTSPNPSCVGALVTLTATPQNGGTTPNYQWKVNGVNVGGNSATYSYTPTQGDLVTCTLTSNGSCISGNPATASQTMTVNPIIPATISISTTTNPFCPGDTVRFATTIVNGGSTPLYQWYVNGSAVGTGTSLFSYVPVNGDVVTCDLTSNAACISGSSTVSSNAVTLNANSNLVVTVTIGVNKNPLCAGSQATFTAVPTNQGTDPIYQWEINGVQVGTNSSVYAYTPNNGDQVRCILTSDLTCATNNPDTSNTITLVVNPVAPVTASISASSNPVCSGNSVTFTSAITNGGGSPVYQWRVNGNIVGGNTTTYTYNPINGQIVTCKVTSSDICATGNPATSNAITMLVFPNSNATVTISSSSNPSCLGSTVTYTAVPFNGGTAPTYQWKVNGLNAGTGGATFNYVPTNGDVITCVMTSNSACSGVATVQSNTITMTVNAPLPVSVTVSPSANPVCQGNSITLTASIQNGGSAPTYQWKVNGVNVGTNSFSYSYTPVTGDVVTCLLTSNATCVSGNPSTSLPTNMIVLPNQAPANSISVLENPLCQGIPAQFTAAAINVGLNPHYSWSVNGVAVGSNSPNFSYVPSDRDTVVCNVTSSSPCSNGVQVLSNYIVMEICNVQHVGITITPSSNPVCTGSGVVLNAQATNAGSNPVYQWRVNGVVVGGNTTQYAYTPTDQDSIECLVTSNATCILGNPALSNKITMTVGAGFVVDVTVSASMNPACQGENITYSANGINGGISPTYQWKVNGINVGSNSSVFTYAPAHGDRIDCEFTSDLACAIGNPVNSDTILMSVDPYLPASLTITSSSNPVCQGILVTYSAIPINGGSMPQFDWFVNGVNMGVHSSIFNYTPNSGDTISSILYSDLLCTTDNPAESNKIIMSVFPPLVASVAIVASDTTLCAGSSVVLSAQATNGGTLPTYQWMVNGVNVGGNSTIFSYMPLDLDTVVCRLNSNANCVVNNPVTSNKIGISVLPVLPVVATISTLHDTVCQGVLTSVVATTQNSGTNPTYLWSVNGIQMGINQSVFDYFPSNGDVVQCQVLSSQACVSNNPANSNSLHLTVEPFLPVNNTVSASLNPTCAAVPITFVSQPEHEGSSPTYQWKVNGVNVGSNQSSYTYLPTDQDIVTCLLTSSSLCATGNPALSNPITMMVAPVNPVVIQISTLKDTVCEGAICTFTALATNTGAAPQYTWFVNGIIVGTNSTTYTYQPQNGDVIYCRVLSSEICPSGNPANSNTIVMTVDPYLPAGVVLSAAPSDSICNGQSVTIVPNAINGGTNPNYQWYLNGTFVMSNNGPYTYTPSNGDYVECIMTSNLHCGTGSPVSSQPITIHVFPYPYTQFNLCSRLTTRDAKPIKLTGGVPAGGAYSGPGVTNGWFNPATIPLGIDSVALTYSRAGVAGCIATSQQYMVLKPVAAFTCGMVYTDPRDNKTYPTNLFGGVCWFTKNLNYGQFASATQPQRNNCIPEKYCFSDNTTNCALFGGLYQWDEMMEYSDSAVNQGFCPPGWHIPSTTEWSALFLVFNGNAYAGTMLKPSANSLTTGFNSLLPGSYFNHQSWSFNNFNTFYWSSNSHGPYKSWAHGLNQINTGVSTYPSSRSNAFSIRCVKD